jgi:hypothetical protein
VGDTFPFELVNLAVIKTLSHKQAELEQELAESKAQIKSLLQLLRQKDVDKAGEADKSPIALH